MITLTPEETQKKRLQSRYTHLYQALVSIAGSQIELEGKAGIFQTKTSTIVCGAWRGFELPTKNTDAKIVSFLRQHDNPNWSMQNLVTFLESDVDFKNFKPCEKSYEQSLDIKALCDQLSFEQRMEFVDRFLNSVGGRLNDVLPIKTDAVEPSIEIWKPIKGYEGSYEVSNQGRVRSLDRDIKNGSRVLRFKGVILKSALYGRGYLCVVLSKEATPQTKLIHNLVAHAFLPNPKNYNFVKHIDGDITNNNASNLKFVSKKPIEKKLLPDA